MLRPFGHPVARCCDMLRGVRCCWLKFENDQIFYATFADVVVVWPGLRMLRPTVLQCVAFNCCDRLAGAL